MRTEPENSSAVLAGAFADDSGVHWIMTVFEGPMWATKWMISEEATAQNPS